MSTKVSRNVCVAIGVSLLTVWLLSSCLQHRSTSTPASLGQPEQSGYVALLVLDNFTTPEHLTETVPSETGNELKCIFTPDGQQRFGAKGLSPNGGDMPHGTLVLSVIDEILQHGDTMIDADPSTLVSQGASLSATQLITATGEQLFHRDWIKDLQLWNTPEGKLLLVPVDISDINTISLTSRLSETIQTIENGTTMAIGDTELGTLEGFVINMSFAFFPCNFDLKLNTVAQDAVADDLLNEYLGVLKPGWSGIVSDIFDDTHNFLQLGGVACDLISDVGVKDLCNLLRNSNGHQLTQKPHVVIAAAGNIGLPFPLAPALFSGVVSVSASDGLGDWLHVNLAKPFAELGFSDWGEVKMNGTHPTHKVKDENDKVMPDDGTSYAAPRVSLQTALYLLRTGNAQCGDEPVLNSKIFRNLTLSDATKKCPDFLNTK